MNCSRVIDHISLWLKQYCQQSATTGFVVGVSGGIDSAVASALAAHTTLPVLCVEMPIHQHSAQMKRASDHIDWLQKRYPNVQRVEVNLSEIFDSFIAELPPTNDERRDMALVNTRARLRMTTLYYFAGLHNRLVVGTGNKVEDFGIGFFTKYGDGGVDLSPIADLNKTEVYAVGQAFGVIESIMIAPPTDGLWGDDRTDADQIGATYPELEWAMAFDGEAGEVDQLSDAQKRVLAIYRRLHRINQHKMNPIPVCLIPYELRYPDQEE